MRRKLSALLGLAAVAAIVATGPADEPAHGPPMGEQSPNSSETVFPQKVTETCVESLTRLSPRVYCGGQPQGDAAFEFLARLGVRAVVSVDGARPDVEAARRAGLSYVHIPLGYDGIAADAGRALTRVARDLDGALYVHCHHGRHRGPAAAAVICLADEAIDHRQALEILEFCGTSRDYAGLWQAVKLFRPPNASAELPDLVEIAPVDSLVAAMVAVKDAMQHLGLCQQADWKSPPGHPDLVPEQQALLLREAFRESDRAGQADHDAQFHAWMVQSERISHELQQAISRLNTPAADRHLSRLKSSCQQCHATYRN